MGVPAFFRWLSTKYPKIISPVIEELPEEVDGEHIPIDISKPNPNGEEFDNLYLDMNNIIHPCTHPEGRPAPSTEEEMMQEVMKYTEQIVNMVRPRKILMMAVDGVAPRAKMNQQRSRRFRAAQDARIEDEKKAEFHKLLIATGKAEAGSQDAVEKKWDTNVITPGTPFMHKLAQSLRYWVAYKLNSDPAWSKLKVIISDASVPGEGEHKVMEFIRSQRRSPEHDPNTRHVIYGLDADLIMLGLATHEPHFRILREDVFAQDKNAKRCSICNQKGHLADECRGEIKEKQGDFDEKEKVSRKPYLWLHVSALREYLEIELQPPRMPFKFDLERAIDDYVFLCFFVGNDFLPHLPSLEIREEGIDNLVSIWKENLPLLGGYITKDGEVDLEKAQHILTGLAKREDGIFRRRREIEERKQQRDKQRKQEKEARDAIRQGDGQRKKKRTGNEISVPDASELFTPGEKFDPNSAARQVNNQMFIHQKEIFQAQLADANNANKSAAAVLKEQLLKRKAATASDASATNADPQDGPPSALGKRKAGDLEDEETGTPGRSTPLPKGDSGNPDDPPPDDVRLWETGYADRYYERKFHADPKDYDFRRKVAAAYVEGVCWVLTYYMQGCPSWQWYYPYHYAPFAADFVGMVDMKPTFDSGAPFHPYEQLMGVFPADSRHAIPSAFHELMTDDDSPIADFYPEDFDVDLNGKKFKWQGVALLPFIDEKRLLAAMKSKEHLLTEDEIARNQFGRETLLFSQDHPMYNGIMEAFYTKKQADTTTVLNAKSSEGLSGSVTKIDSFMPSGPLDWPFYTDAMPSLPIDNSMSVYYEIPTSKNVHKSQLLRGLIYPERKLNAEDKDLQRHRSMRGGRGRGRGGRGGYDNRNGGGRHSDPGPPPRINQENPFAAHLNPGLMPPHMQDGPPQQAFGGIPPPPWLAAQQGFAPPPPPGFTGHLQPPQSYGQNNGGYQGGRQGGQGGGNYNSYNAPQQHNGDYAGGRDNYGGGRDGHGGRDNYGGGRDSYNGHRGGQNNNGYNSGGYNGGGYDGNNSRSSNDYQSGGGRGGYNNSRPDRGAYSRR